MTTFIGAEYVIAYTLISNLKRGLDAVTFQEVRDFANKFQIELNKNDVDAVVISHSLPDAVYQFSEYFESVSLNNENYIKCKRGTSLSKLESRFLGYLPLKVLNIANNLMNS